MMNTKNISGAVIIRISFAIVLITLAIFSQVMWHDFVNIDDLW